MWLFTANAQMNVSVIFCLNGIAICDYTISNFYNYLLLFADLSQDISSFLESACICVLEFMLFVIYFMLIQYFYSSIRIVKGKSKHLSLFDYALLTWYLNTGITARITLFTPILFHQFLINGWKNMVPFMLYLTKTANQIFVKGKYNRRYKYCCVRFDMGHFDILFFSVCSKT